MQITHRIFEPARGGETARGAAGFGLRHLLLALVVAVLVPPLAAGAVVTWQAVEAYRAASEERLQSTARALALAAEGEIARIRPALSPFAGSALIGPEASPVQLAEFHRLATRQAEAFGTWVWLSGTAPDLLPVALSTRVPFGAPLPPLDPQRSTTYSTMLEVAHTGRPAVSPVYHSALLDRPMAATAVPVVRDGRVVRVLAAALDPARLSAILAAQGLEEGAVAVLVDDRGTVAARSSRAEEFVGRPMPAWHSGIGAGPDGGIVEGTALDRRDMVFGYRRLVDVAPGWAMLVGVPRAAHEASWRRPLLWLGAVAAVAVLIAALAAMRLARRLLRPLAALTARATDVVRAAAKPWEQATPGGGPAVTAAGIAEFDALRDAFDRADAALRREAAATRRERDLLQSVVDSCGDAIFVKDTEGRYALINRAGSAVLGRPAAEVLGRTNAVLMPQEVAARLGTTDREVMADGRVRLSEDTVVQDGRPRLFQSSKSPWRDPGTGRLLGLIGVARDVTDLRREEERRRAAEADLQRLARRAMAGAMAGGIAHEVNQPLAALANYLGAARRLLDRAGTSPDPALVAEAREVAARAASEAVRAGAILRRVREFIGNGGSPPGPEPARRLLEEAAALVLAGHPADAARVRVSVEDGVGEVRADRVGVQQVVANLVRNALEATAAEGGPVHVTAARRAAGPGGAGMVEIAVVDDGPGLDPEVRGRLFEAFVGTKPDGMGLGLFISRTIVEAQAGRIRAEAGPGGRGTAVRFTLPAAGARERAGDG